MNDKRGNLGKFEVKFARLPVRFLINLGLTAPSSSIFSLYIIMARTKSTLGRVLARYYNWYGMTGRLRAYLKGLGWTEERIASYDKANHLTVSKDHEGQNPRVPAPSDTAWLKAHGPLPGWAKSS